MQREAGKEGTAVPRLVKVSRPSVRGQDGAEPPGRRPGRGMGSRTSSMDSVRLFAIKQEQKQPRPSLP